MRSLALLPLLAACAPERDCASELWFVDDGTARRVEVVGDWTGWRPEPLDAVEAGAWALAVELPPGDYAYQLVVDGRRQLDLYQPLLTSDPVTGAERSLLRVDACDQPDLSVDAVSASPDGAASATATFLRVPGGPRLDAASVVAEVDGRPARVSADAAAGAVDVSATGLPRGKHHLRITAADKDGAAVTIDAPVWVEDAPFQWRDGLVYQVMVDRFARADGALVLEGDGAIADRLGGTLAGVKKKLDEGYFEELGATVLWLGPVQPNPDGWWEGRDGERYTSYHGYWPVERFGVDRRIGTEQELRDLVAAAHLRGMRVLLDVVPNHVHQDHPWAVRGWSQGDADCICGSAACPWSEAIETCWFTPYLPDLDWSRPAVVDAVTGDLERWARDMDLDGFRVDAVPMMPRAAIRHLTATVHDRLEQGPTRFFLLGETFTGPGDTQTIRANLGPHGLDGQFDFPVMWALRGYAAWRSADASDLEAALRRSEAAWEGSGAVMSPFVGNHDVSRFLSEAAGDDTSDPWGAPPPQPGDALPYRKLVLAQAIALSLPGMPVIWQGDELGLAGATDPDCRRPVPFGDELTEPQAWTLARTRRLGRARREVASLRRGRRVPLVAEGAVYAHLRDAGDGRPALLVANASGAETSISFRTPPGVRVDTTLTDALEGVETLRISPGAETTLRVPAWTARLYIPHDAAALEAR
jgi:glycosidase